MVIVRLKKRGGIEFRFINEKKEKASNIEEKNWQKKQCSILIFRKPDAKFVIKRTTLKHFFLH